MAITALPTPPSRSAPSTFSTLADAFLGALPTFQSEANAVALAMDLNDTSDTSASSITIGTGAKTFTVTAGKSFLPGMSLKIARTSSPSNWMHGDVTTYSTDQLVMNITSIYGSGGPFTDWTITFSAPTVVPVAIAESDFIVGAPSPFGSWIKKTLVEAKALLGLVITAGKTITCSQNTSLDEAVAMSSKAAKFRVSQLQITGLTDATTVRLIMTDIDQGENLAQEDVDQDTPTGGTRFDISADGTIITIKGMTKTATTLLFAVVGLSENGAVNAIPAAVVGGKLVLTIRAAATGIAEDLTSWANGQGTYIRLFYRTSD